MAAALHEVDISRVLAVTSVLGLSGCCLSLISGNGRNDAGEGPAQCASAGGSCVLPLSCAGTVLSAYDCNPDRNPAGEVCCLASPLEDAGSDGGIDGGPNSGMDAGDSGMADSGSQLDAGSCGPASDLTSFVTYTSLSLNYIATADLNGDGMLDLIALASGLSFFGFYVFFGQPDGGLSSPISYALAAPAEALAIGDINGDGSQDLVVSTNGIKNLLLVFVNDGGGGFAPRASYTTSEFTLGIAIGDLNGDGLADVAFTQNTGVQLLLGEPDSGFSAPVSLPGVAVNSSGALAIGDLNHDGLADLVAGTSRPTNNRLAVLLNRDDGGFQTNFYSIAAPSQLLLLPNGGPAPDLILGETGESSGALSGPWSALGLEVLKNSGEGTFSDGRVYSVPGGYSLAIGDFNGDCLTDIATTAPSPYGCQAGWQIAVLYGDGDGGFTGPQVFNAVGSGPNGIAALGQVGNPRAFAVSDYCGGGLTVYGDASRH